MAEQEQGSVRFGATEIYYEVVRSKRRKKTVTLSLTAEGLTVRAPVRFSSDALREVVQRRAAWILAKQSRLNELYAHFEPPKRFVSGESLLYLGRQYRLKLVEDGLGRARLSGGFLKVPKGEPERVRSTLIAWYTQQAERRLKERVALYSVKLGVTPTCLFIRDQQKRWGSCNAKGELRFNWRIMMAPLSLVDYVVVHELVHLEHMNHSKAFWRRLREILPDYQARHAQLARSGIRYQL